MQYLYHPDAKASVISLVEGDYKYIIKARRHKIGDTIALRNLADSNLYRYQIETISKKEATLKLLDFEVKSVEAKNSLHIGWCVIDPKTVEKHIASLNEIGVAKITFIYCDRSQKNFKIDFKRLEKILINSSSQCGRSSIITLDSCPTLQAFQEANPNATMINFSNQFITKASAINTVVLGCEGGFTQEEIELYNDNTLGFDTPLILKSESAAVAVASTLLL
ncbi:MAG: 16S rRNA (uracil(1498)-N(3))-methyltransferase [Campylobacterota bacterium]|nr:16S rRNA (uracil(1498)-N(3))-methyltransferase [Campylobacterota bacterium]